MPEVRQTEKFALWLAGLSDGRAVARINARIRRLSLGNPGDVKPVGEGISEMRIDYGPGYRVYFVQRGAALVILLAGGDKGSQGRDIAHYLDAVFEDGDPALITAALGDVARAKGMSQVAQEAGLGRESLYKALSPEGNPEFGTVLKVIRALGLKLKVAV